jgi:hypothetical protein
MFDDTIAGIPHDLALPGHAAACEPLSKIVLFLVDPLGRALELGDHSEERAVEAIAHREGRIVDGSCGFSRESSEHVAERVVPELLDARAELAALLLCDHCT